MLWVIHHQSQSHPCSKLPDSEAECRSKLLAKQQQQSGGTEEEKGGGGATQTKKYIPGLFVEVPPKFETWIAKSAMFEPRYMFQIILCRSYVKFARCSKG